MSSATYDSPACHVYFWQLQLWQVPSTEDIEELLECSATEEIEYATQLPALGAGTDAELCTRTEKEEDTLVTCEFDCGPPMPRKDMMNKAIARSLCWVFPPCYCAMRAIIRSWSATPETKAMLDNLRAKDKFRWHALVRQCRIRSSPEEAGLTNLRIREKAILDSTQSMAQAFGVRDTADVLWLTRPRFIAHHVYVEGMEGATL